jgi:hypothetical protein
MQNTGGPPHTLYEYHVKERTRKLKWSAVCSQSKGFFTRRNLAGSSILNTMKEELPKVRESRFWAFTIGAVIYSALLIIV